LFPVTCLYCGGKSEARSVLAKYCSPACRKRDYVRRGGGEAIRAASSRPTVGQNPAVNRTVRQTPEIPRTARVIPTVEKAPALEVPAIKIQNLDSEKPPPLELAPMLRVESTTTDPTPRQVEPAPRTDPVSRDIASVPTPEALDRARRLLGFRGAIHREGVEALLARRLAARGISPEAKLRFREAAEVLFAALEVRQVG
jgi:hypothetical protein